ncbi:MAG: hypothetical protein QG635_1690, partial [Bacteroidota bacterium]|nr:hypothetical protein [Bacteroidota bacterium]
MLIFYLVCLILGGGLIASSLILGGHYGGDISHDLDAHSGISHELASETESGDAASYSDISHDITHSSGNHLITHENPADSIKLISFRNLTYFMAFFGLTGTGLNILGVSSFFSFFSSVVLGSIAAYYGYRLMKYFKSSETGQALNIYDLKGRTGKIILNVSKSIKGKISIDVGGRTCELMSKVSDISVRDSFRIGEE